MDKKLKILIFTIIVISTSIMMVSLFLQPNSMEIKSGHELYNKLYTQNNTILIRPILVSLSNQTLSNATSLVVNTKQQDNYTVLMLANNAVLKDMTNSIKAGDVILLRMVEGTPVCSFQFENLNGTIIQNKIIDVLLTNEYQFKKLNYQPCDNGSRIQDITSWSKLR